MILGSLVLVAFACGGDDGAAGGDPSATGTAGETSGGETGATGSASAGSSSSGAESSSESGESGESSSTGEAPPECPEPPVEPPCEASGAGRCFYIDPIAGDDAADGSVEAPWRSFVNVNVSIYRDAGVALHGGDVVYVREGSVDAVYHPGDDTGPEGGGNYLAYFRGLHGDGSPITIKGYPGERPVLDAPPDTVGMLVTQSSEVVIEGLEVRNAWERGIRIEESQDVEVARVLVYDTDGTASNNIAGLEVLGSQNVEIRDSVFADNYDRAAARAGMQTENSGNLVLFGNAGTIAIRRCAFYQSEGPSSEFSGFGVKYKHASRSPDASFEVSDSYFEGNVFAIGIGTAHADVHHNVVVDSRTGVASRDFGGTTHQWDQRIAMNTIAAEIALYVSPTLDWVDHEGGPWPDVTQNAVEGNIVVDTAPMHGGEMRTVLFNAYMSDALHDALTSGIALDGNCYHWAGGAASFGFAESEDYGPAGGAFDLDGWRATYGFDPTSIEADPQLDEHVPAAGSPCAQMGAFTDGHAPVVGLADPVACGDAAMQRRWE